MVFARARVIGVAPREGLWIEMITGIMANLNGRVAPRKGGAD